MAEAIAMIKDYIHTFSMIEDWLNELSLEGLSVEVGFSYDMLCIIIKILNMLLLDADGSHMRLFHDELRYGELIESLFFLKLNIKFDEYNIENESKLIETLWGSLVSNKYDNMYYLQFFSCLFENSVDPSIRLFFNNNPPLKSGDLIRYTNPASYALLNKKVLETIVAASQSHWITDKEVVADAKNFKNWVNKCGFVFEYNNNFKTMLLEELRRGIVDAFTDAAYNAANAAYNAANAHQAAADAAANANITATAAAAYDLTADTDLARAIGAAVSQATQAFATASGAAAAAAAQYADAAQRHAAAQLVAAANTALAEAMKAKEQVVTTFGKDPTTALAAAHKAAHYYADIALAAAVSANTAYNTAAYQAAYAAGSQAAAYQAAAYQATAEAARQVSAGADYIALIAAAHQYADALIAAAYQAADKAYAAADIAADIAAAAVGPAAQYLMRRIPLSYYMDGSTQEILRVLIDKIIKHKTPDPTSRDGLIIKSLIYIQGRLNGEINNALAIDIAGNIFTLFEPLHESLKEYNYIYITHGHFLRARGGSTRHKKNKKIKNTKRLSYNLLRLKNKIKMTFNLKKRVKKTRKKWQ